MDEREEAEAQNAEARYNALRGLFGALKEMERSLEIAADTVDNAWCLRTCADALQEVREHYWPMWLRAQRER